MATATQTLAGRLTLDELVETLEYKKLTPQMGLFVSTYVTHFVAFGTLDPMFACEVAYDTENARVFAYGLMGNPKIRAAIDKFFGRTERESFINHLQKRIESGTLTIADWRGAALLCRLKGWAALPADASSEEPAATESENSENPERYAVGDVVLIDGKKCRVNEINNVGRPIDVDEIA